MKKTVKRKVYNYSKADWTALNFYIRRIDWESHIGMHDAHESWPLFRTAMERLCDKHIPKKTISNDCIQDTLSSPALGLAAARAKVSCIQQ